MYINSLPFVCCHLKYIPSVTFLVWIAVYSDLGNSSCEAGKHPRYDTNSPQSFKVAAFTVFLNTAFCIETEKTFLYPVEFSVLKSILTNAWGDYCENNNALKQAHSFVLKLELLSEQWDCRKDNHTFSLKIKPLCRITEISAWDLC